MIISVTGCWDGPLQRRTTFTCPFFILTGFSANCSSVLRPRFWILDGTFGHTDRVRKNVSQLSLSYLLSVSGLQHQAKICDPIAAYKIWDNGWCH